MFKFKKMFGYRGRSNTTGVFLDLLLASHVGPIVVTWAFKIGFNPENSRPIKLTALSFFFKKKTTWLLNPV